ncbi:sigma-70 family RNA polymerase sigma factor [Paracoccus aminophilus]|uniref:ECF subfamily RNA polymerase sigma-24 factor n=1 Tax=Paracoccus aminophilus JCM 7686 TaxID=1367847 RepID=S5Y0C4_PARAH|nr:sigma-70 family RNA polymerase sigma factor [Paracoccus aminophilus]AGT10982.1 ECF subfamily RNA polymerase sigma-24 factor [Paracoccus aminophilus JCM 7686]
MTSTRPSERLSEDELQRLMLSALDGDGPAYRALLEALTPRLRTYFQRRLFDGLAAQTDDLVQDTLLAIHNRRLTFDPALPLLAWVHAIARHKLIDTLRRERRGARAGLPLPLDDLADLLADPQPHAAQAEDRRDVETLLAALPARSRDVITKVRLEGKTLAETAAETGLSVASVKVIIHRGLAALKNRLGGGA